jgi:RHS repeat-associated protein
VYDGNGNRLTRAGNGLTTQYTYDAADQLLSMESTRSAPGPEEPNWITLGAYPFLYQHPWWRGDRLPEGLPWGTYTWDGAGNLVEEVNAAGRTTYAWDGENRLLSIQFPRGSRETYTYAADGLRRSKTTPHGHTRFVWDGPDLLLELDESGETDAAYTYAPGAPGWLVSQRREDESRYAGFDPQGNLRLLTDAGGVVSDTYSFHAFGDRERRIGSDVNPFRYGGEVGYYEDGKDRLYVRARHYRSDLGLWLSADPVASEPPYLYVYNAPATLIDPAGTQAGLYPSVLATAPPPAAPGPSVVATATVALPPPPSDPSVVGVSGPSPAALLARLFTRPAASSPSVVATPDSGLPPGHPFNWASGGFGTASGSSVTSYPDLIVPIPPAPNVPAMAPLALANHFLPHALAALASAESRVRPARNQPTPAAQALALLQNDAAFGKGLIEGFYTEACETFNPVQWFTVLKDFIFCAIEIWGDYQLKHLSIETIFKQRALSPLVHLWDQLLQTAGKLNAEAWGKITRTILFHLIVGLVVGFFTEGAGAAVEGAVTVSRLSQLPRAAQVAIRTAQGAQILRAFSAGHDPNNPCAGPVVGALTLAVGWAAGKAFGAAVKKGKKRFAARAAVRQGELARELPAPEEVPPVSGSNKGALPAIPAEEGLARTAAIRDLSGLDIGKDRTAAYAELHLDDAAEPRPDIEALPDEVVGFSGEKGRGGLETKWQNNNPGSVVAGPTERPIAPGWQDAEVKVIDHIRKLLAQHPTARGTIRLFVDQPAGKGVCSNCTEVILEFRCDFSGRIRLIVSAN